MVPVTPLVMKANDHKWLPSVLVTFYICSASVSLMQGNDRKSFPHFLKIFSSAKHFQIWRKGDWIKTECFATCYWSKKKKKAEIH